MYTVCNTCHTGPCSRSSRAFSLLPQSHYTDTHYPSKERIVLFILGNQEVLVFGLCELLCLLHTGDDDVHNVILPHKVSIVNLCCRYWYRGVLIQSCPGIKRFWLTNMYHESTLLLLTWLAVLIWRLSSSWGRSEAWGRGSWWGDWPPPPRTAPAPPAAQCLQPPPPPTLPGVDTVDWSLVTVTRVEGGPVDHVFIGFQ